LYKIAKDYSIYVLLDFDILSTSMEITYFVQVVPLECFTDKTNFSFSTSKAAKCKALN
jgi:hypothetical protein